MVAYGIENEGVKDVFLDSYDIVTRFRCPQCFKRFRTLKIGLGNFKRMCKKCKRDYNIDIISISHINEDVRLAKVRIWCASTNG